MLLQAFYLSTVIPNTVDNYAEDAVEARKWCFKDDFLYETTFHTLNCAFVGKIVLLLCFVMRNFLEINSKIL